MTGSELTFQGGRWLVFIALLLTTACGSKNNGPAVEEETSPYLLVFAGDRDEKESDFVMMLDIDPKSEMRGEPVSSLAIGYKNSMPHHMEYVPPPKGEPVFMNGHSEEISMIVDISNPQALKITKTFSPPSPYRFPHDYTRTPSGTRLVGFLRSDGDSPDPEEEMTPGGHGGIAEYSVNGDLIRTASAAVEGMEEPVRPYAFALLPEVDRLVVTSAPMMEQSWADVVQIYRYSDFELLHTLSLPAGRLKNGKIVEGSQAAGFGPRVLDDGSVFLNAYGCAFYHLSEIETDKPQLDVAFTLKTKPSTSPSTIRGACGIPFRIGHYWIQPVGHMNMVLVLDITDPLSPKEAFRLKTPKEFKPHWLTKDPLSNRLILGAELGGEQGFYMLRFDDSTGKLAYDPDFQAKAGKGLFRSKRLGYISLEKENWPHGDSGFAWGHAALFIND